MRRILLASSIAVVLAVSLSLSGWTSSSSQQSTITINPGADLLSASGSLILDLPAGFFGAGSEPVQASLAVEGVGLGTGGPFELGTTSLILERLARIDMTWPSSPTLRCDIELSDLHVRSQIPFSVVVAGVAEDWNVAARANRGRESVGHYDMSRTSIGSGVVEGSVRAPIQLTFTRVRDGATVRHDLGMVDFDLEAGSWGDLSSSPTSSLDVAGIPLGVAISVDLSSSSLELIAIPSQADPNRPGPRHIDPTANVSSAVGSLGRSCIIGPNVTIESGVVVGPYAVIAEGAHISVDAIIGDGARVGVGAFIGTTAALGDSTTVAAGSIVSAAAQVHEDAVVGNGAVVGAGAIIGAQASLGRLGNVGNNCKVGRNVIVGSSSIVDDDLILPTGLEVPAGAHITSSFVVCERLDGVLEYRELPTTGWDPSLPSVVILDEQAVISAPFATVVIPGTAAAAPAPPIHEVVDPGSPPPGLTTLPGDIGNDIAPPNGGGTGQSYSAGNGYQCGWFAEQLRAKLEHKGYDTTFTCVWDRNPKARWYNRQPTWTGGHALVDIHWPDGTTTWIEAQHAGGDGVDLPTPGLDGDGNGTVEAHVGVHKGKTTDGQKRVEVYSDRAEAEQAGANIAGN